MIEFILFIHSYIARSHVREKDMSNHQCMCLLRLEASVLVLCAVDTPQNGTLSNGIMGWILMFNFPPPLQSQNFTRTTRQHMFNLKLTKQISFINSTRLNKQYSTAKILLKDIMFTMSRLELSILTFCIFPSRGYVFLLEYYNA